MIFCVELITWADSSIADLGRSVCQSPIPTSSTLVWLAHLRLNGADDFARRIESLQGSCWLDAWEFSRVPLTPLAFKADANVAVLGCDLSESERERRLRRLDEEGGGLPCSRPKAASSNRFELAPIRSGRL